MGEVYLARRRGIGGFERTVVLKVMLPHLAGDERFTRMFVDEARIASGLSHPNVVQVHDLGTSEMGGLYLAMEHLQGVSAIACLKHCASVGQWIPPEVAARVVCDAATGLAYAHGAAGEDGQTLGLVHRDVSPENIFMTYAGLTKVLDFGVAKVRDRLVETQAGEFKGKVGYMAPEIIRGQEPDGRADLFSLGVVFFELLTHRRLFHAPVPATSLHRVLSAPIPDVRTLREDVDEPIAQLVSELLERDRRRRVASAEVTADRLESWLSGRPGTHKHVSRWLQEHFADAHELSARIAKAVERTGRVDPDHLREARRLNGDALADTVVRALSDGERKPLKTGTDAEFDPDDTWIRNDTRSRGFLLALVFVLALATVWWASQQQTQRSTAEVWANQYVEGEYLYRGTAGSLLRAQAQDGDDRFVIVAERLTTPTAGALSALEECRRKLEQLGDPGLPAPVAVGVHRERPFSAYALESGRSLAQVLQSEVVDSARGLRLLRSVAEVMAVAEEGRLIHGWLSADVVWITNNDQVRILGFRGPRPVVVLPTGGSGMPTPLAPELRAVGAPAGPAADQYALASLISEALPQLDQRSSVAAATVLARAMAVEPGARFKTTGEFVGALERSLRSSRRR